MKKILSVGLVMGLVGLFATSSMAFTWDTCGIERIGAEGVANNLLKVTGCGVAANNGKWLALVQQKDTAMATLLTAFSLGKKVKLSADFASATTSGSVRGAVDVIYLNK